MTDNFKKYLRPSYFLNFENPLVETFSRENCNPKDNPREKAIQLYYGVRDKIQYDPYDVQPDRSTLRASSVVQKHSGYCVAKAVLLAAVARQQNIPARLGFADVTNHLSSKKLQKIMNSDLFIYHGYTEIYLENKWVKATPAFNLSLCRRFNVKPLEFDGRQDSLFHEYDIFGNKHMEYVAYHGNFTDLPFETIFAAYEAKYPGMFARFKALTSKDFCKEVEEENDSLLSGSS